MSEIITNNETENVNENAAATASYASISVNPTSLEFDSNASYQYVTVSCSDTSWTVGGNGGWCTIQKISNTRAKISVTTNTGSARVTGVVCLNGTKVATIVVNQAAPDAPDLPDPIDLSDMITHYSQKQGEYNCAGICACMCVNDSPENVRAKCDDPDDPNDDNDDVLYPADWGEIAKHYGYNVSTGSCTIDYVYTILKSGYPVIAHINDGTNGKLEHWVVVTGYDGDGEDMSASNFICDDPLKSSPVRLNKAINYNKVVGYVCFKKK